MTVALLFGTRPEAIKLWPLVDALAARGMPVRLVATAQHRALLDDVLRTTGLRPDVDLDLMRAGIGLPTGLARLIDGLGDSLSRSRPDRIVVQGDTMTALAGATVGHLLSIPVAHVEAGLRTGDLAAPWPEEGIRRMIAPVADLHLAPTERARAALLAEGVDSRAVHVTGNTGIDALLNIRARGDALPPALAAIMTRQGDRRMLLVTAHRRENFGEGLAAIAEAVARLADRGDLHIVMPVHPNPAVGSVFRRRLAGHPAVALLDPLDYPTFVAMMGRATLILSDSGGVQEEAPALGRPLLVLRERSERSEAIESGGALLVGTDTARIVAAAERLLDDDTAYRAMAVPRFPFGDGRAAERIAAILAA